ncbi:MAG: cytochrome c [Planctomycetota bacterium]|nr:cytochrome c [Planctomycetota bacterium]
MDTPENAPNNQSDFWSCRCLRFSKEMMLFVLVSGFILQTCLVYSDHFDTLKLTEHQSQGRRIWHANNCQTCHQLHGFGGFLGPDLTNATQRVERAQLDSLLTQGLGQMPAFKMKQDEIDSIWAYLEAMDATGIGQARNPNLDRLRNAEALDESIVTASTPHEALQLMLAESDDGPAAYGYELFRMRSCLDCHVFFGRSSVGAPDLSISGKRLSDDELGTVLRIGRLPKMPTPRLDYKERESVRAFIRFMADNRTETLARVTRKKPSYLFSLPWWEYR